MKKIVVAAFSVAFALVVILAIGSMVGIILNESIAYSDKVISLVYSITPHESFPVVLVKVYACAISFIFIALSLPLLAFVKAFLLPRNVNLSAAYDMEMEKSYRNTWLLFASFSGNFKIR